MPHWFIPSSRPPDRKRPVPKFCCPHKQGRRVPQLRSLQLRGWPPIAVAESGAEEGRSSCPKRWLCGSKWFVTARMSRRISAVLSGACFLLVTSDGNFLCPGQEERNLRETKIHIGNSRLVAESSLILDDVLKMEEKVCSTYSGILLLG
jgi:hypothetical protein